MIVKTDTEGPLTRCVNATVLEKESKTADFLEIPVEGGDADEFVPQPAGTYMKINTTQFNAEVDEGAVIDFGKRETTADRRDHYPLVQYPVNLSVADPNIPGSSFTDYDIPAVSYTHLTLPTTPYV